MSNLQEKWDDKFHFVDINNDSLVDMADVTMIQDNYVRLHNLSAEEVCADWVTIHERFKEHTHTNVDVLDI